MTSADVHNADDPSFEVRPGWIQVALAAAAYIALFFGAYLVGALISDSRWRGVALGAWSGVMGLGAFAIAFFSRKPRSSVAFGLRAVSWKWILAGIGLGLVAYVLTKVVTIALLLISPSDTNVQQDYVTAASAGPLLLLLNLIGLAVITPLGEEFAFRGVLANALQKYGFWISVIASTIVFALAHGVNLVIVPAVFVGFAAALLFWKTKSVWPGVAVHAVNNGLGIALVGLLGSSGA